MKNLSRQELYANYLITNSQDYISASDTDVRITVFNPAAERAFGYTKEELSGKHVSVLYSSKEEYEKISESLQKTGQYSGEVTNIRKNGEEFICYLSANRIYDAHGNNVGIMGVSRDITKQKEMIQSMVLVQEENIELLDEFKSLSKIATSVMNGIVITDIEGRIKWSNDSFTRITGYDKSEMLGFLPSQVFRVPHFFQEEFKQITAGGPKFNEAIQVPHYKKNGELYWILVESTPVYDDDGELKEIIEVCTEITAQKNAELALIESEQNFRQISETIQDVFFLYNNKDKNYEYISPNSFNVLGMEAERFYDNEPFINTMILKEDRHIIRKARLDNLNNKTYNIEYRILVDGQVRWIHERAFPIIDLDSDISKSSGVCSDITTAKMDQELIDAQNRNINESIQYAMLIQEATLPERADMQDVFEEYFVLYRPKGMLSGDFFVVDHVKPKGGRACPAFVVADCTGHGVPGAILSILCSSLIKQSFTSHEIHSPKEALNTVRKQLNRAFKSRDSKQVNDGMDVAFCVLNPETRELSFSGANLSCHILRKNKWHELKGDKQHVGYSEQMLPFTEQSFDCEIGDQIYLFTDGYADQFGGGKNKKYMKRRFMEFLLSISDEPMSTQEDLVRSEFGNWMGAEEQTDDVCVFGVKVT